MMPINIALTKFCAFTRLIFLMVLLCCVGIGNVTASNNSLSTQGPLLAKGDLFAKQLPAIWLLLDDGVRVIPESDYPHIDVTTMQASKFLTQATFGPNTASINALVAQNNLEAWINQQMLLPISRTYPYVQANSNGSLRTTRHHIWWQNVMQGDDQLRQRVAFALSEIFVISDLDYELGNSQYGVTDFYDMLAENAFGNYRTLLEKVTLHPTMGVYLGMLRNQKANPALFIRPDENYAREVLQLFSIGLYELGQDGQTIPLNSPVDSYSQETVENFARVFTGWNFADSPGVWTSNDLTSYDKTRAMVADYQPAPPNSFHDTGTKTLLNGAVLANSSGVARPTESDTSFALNNIFNHPNVPPFFSKLLIQRLTTSNPSPAYVKRVADKFVNNGRGQRGDIGEVVKAILLDNEARFGKVINPDFGKVKEPILQLSQLWRAFDAQLGTTAQGEYRLSVKSADRIDEVFGQAVLKSRSVFNFFLPENPLSNSSASGLLGPEMQIMTEANIASIHNAFYEQVYTYNNQSGVGSTTITRLNIDDAVGMGGNIDNLLDYLARLLLGNTMPPSMREAIKQHLVNVPSNYDRVRDAIFIIVASPQFMVEG